MNHDSFAGILTQFSGRLKENWGMLINNRRVENAGRRRRLAGRIQADYGRCKEQAAHELKEFFARNRNPDIPAR